ncbi:hypothetical protein DBV15_08121 [Temnothorax longispinosus]|uniref:Uncharacterized protein n=1 Tax=Temnothorax longispinosus TaxID=300112 RepID=A0A4S2KLI7_9HYME|nr:hypothetical protein DBV15_08121 [Temnothorax longispinosus]
METTAERTKDRGTIVLPVRFARADNFIAARARWKSYISRVSYNDFPYFPYWRYSGGGIKASRERYRGSRVPREFSHRFHVTNALRVLHDFPDNAKPISVCGSRFARTLSVADNYIFPPRRGVRPIKRHGHGRRRVASVRRPKDRPRGSSRIRLETDRIRRIDRDRVRRRKAMSEFVKTHGNTNKCKKRWRVERETEEKSERQAMPQQKTIVVPPEGNVNFCAVGQCYRRRAQSAARQNFVRFYMRIGWSSSTRDPSLYPPPRCRTATSRASRAVCLHLGPCRREAYSPLPRTHLHLEKPTEFLCCLDPKTKTSAFLPIIGNKVAEPEANRREDKQSERERKGRKRSIPILETGKAASSAPPRRLPVFEDEDKVDTAKNLDQAYSTRLLRQRRQWRLKRRRPDDPAFMCTRCREEREKVRCRRTLFASFIRRTRVNEETRVSAGRKAAEYNEQPSGTPREFPPRPLARPPTMAAIIRETLLKIKKRNRALGSTANGNALKKRDERKERISYARKDTELFRAAVVSMTSNTWPFVERRRKKKKKQKTRDGKNGERDANIFDSRRSQRGESVQKVSLRQRQVTTYTHEGGIQGGGELPGRDLRLGRHLPDIPIGTFVSLIDATRARVYFPKCPRFDNRLSVAPYVLFTCRTNLTRRSFGRFFHSLREREVHQVLRQRGQLQRVDIRTREMAQVGTTKSYSRGTYKLNRVSVLLALIAQVCLSTRATNLRGDRAHRPSMPYVCTNMSVKLTRRGMTISRRQTSQRARHNGPAFFPRKRSDGINEKLTQVHAETTSTRVLVTKHVVAVKKLNSRRSFCPLTHTLVAPFFRARSAESHSEGNTPGGEERRESKRFSLFIPAIISDNVAR